MRLTTLGGEYPFALAPLGGLKGRRALTGRVSENGSALSSRAGNLTGRFIKAPTALIFINQEGVTFSVGRGSKDPVA